MPPPGISISHGFVYRDGKEYFLSDSEIKIISTKPFHLWPYALKKLLPQRRSCARCAHRPVDFSRSSKRMIKEPRWKYKTGVTDEQIVDAVLLDAVELTNEHDKLKNIRPCPVCSWSRASPFYNVLHCEAGEWNHDFITF